MNLETDLKRLCAPKTLQRARQIASSDQNILTKKCRFDHSGTHISAFVASSHGWNDCYRTAVSIDEENGSVFDYSCTCPAYLQYDGPCKHCAALVYSYIDRPERFMGYKEQRNPQTTTCLSTLLKETDAARRGSLAGLVDIEPTFRYAYHTWSISFKLVGPNGSYVMKDIGHFAALLNCSAYHSYGKKLAFTHTLDAFTPRGRALASVIDRCVTSRKRISVSSRVYDAAREMALSDFEVLDFLEAMGDAPFLVEGGDYGVRARTTAHVETSDPSIAVEMREDAHGGYVIECPTRAVVIADTERMCLWIDDTFYRTSPALARCAAFVRMVAASEVDNLYISESDMPVFCAALLPQVEKSLDVKAPESVEAYRPVDAALEFYFDKSDAAITCEAFARYGGHRRRLGRNGASWEEAQGATALPLPDEQAERSAYALLGSYLDDPSPKKAASDAGAHCLSLDAPGRVAELLFGGLARFKDLGEVFTTAAFDRLTSDKKPRVSVGVSLSGNLIDLDVHASDLDAGELGALLSSYRARKRYHRLKTGAYLDIAELDLAQLDRLAADLDISPKALDEGTVELPAYRAFYLDDTLHEARRDGAFTEYVERFRTAKRENRAVPEALQAQLRPYQQEGFAWMNALADMKLGGILADEMGLGKSVQLIAFLLAHLEEYRSVGPALIVCPASLVYNWMAEIERFAPTLRARAVAGTKQERIAARAEADIDVIVTSYDLLRIDIKDYAEREFSCCALDEAQYIKNHGTLTARAVKRVRAQQRFALTGTPMENRLSEIWSIFDFLMPGFLGSYMRFRERFELDIIGGNDNAAERLQALVGPFMLRRLKADVLTDLPDKLESAVYVHMTRKQEKLYLAYEQQLREALAAQRRERKNKGESKGPGVEVLAELMRLRQLCCDPRLALQDYEEPGAKVGAIVDLVESAINDGQKTLVFSQFTSFLSLIASALDAQGIAYYTITGATPKRERVTLVDAFNEDDTPVFLVSLKAGGTGLNLTGASVVVHADPWWNAAAQAQATDRAHRIGQTHVVSVHQVIAKGTIEERIVALQQAKNELADKVVGNTAMPLSSLTADDLLGLLEG